MNRVYVEDALAGEALRFDVCRGGPPNFLLLRLQCSGNIIADPIRGPRIATEEHLGLCRAAAQKAHQNNVEVFLTPEYSFPYELITEMLNGSLPFPEVGKLWCLCCQGIRVTEFEDVLTQWESLGARVVRTSLNDASRRNFVGVLIYAFRSESGTKCLVPQLKTHQMSDPEYVCEGQGLTTGQTIFMFGKGDANLLCSIICADLLNRNINVSFLLPEDTSNLVLLHPQLNAGPRHRSFGLLRKALFSDNLGSRLVYITANWGAQTVVGAAKTMKIGSPWSCIYVKCVADGALTQRLRAEIEHNDLFGVGYAYWDDYHTDIWYSTILANLQMIEIRKPNPADACVGTSQHPVWAISCDTPEGIGWVRPNASLFDQRLPDEVVATFHESAGLSVQDRDRFFGLCLGSHEAGQFLASEDERCARLAVRIDDECERLRFDAASRFCLLVNCLKDGHGRKVGIRKPVLRLSSLHMNYNLFPAKGNDSEGILVSFVEYSHIADAKRALEAHLQPFECRRAFLFFLQPGTNNFALHSLADTSITSPVRSSSQKSILRCDRNV